VPAEYVFVDDGSPDRSYADYEEFRRLVAAPRRPGRGRTPSSR